MKYLRYIVSLAIIFSLFVPSALAEQTFTDVDDDFWAKDEIEYLADEGIIGGYDDGTFNPNAPVTRSQAAIMLVRALDLDTDNRPAADFNDVNEDFHAYDVVATVQDEGIITGRDGNFMPNDTLTRGQMAAILNRSFDLPTGDISFTDISEDSTFYNDIANIAEAGITTGYSEDNTFRPNNDTTRAQFSVFLARVLDDSFRVSDDDEDNGDGDTTYPTVSMEAHFLDVGQGDATLIVNNQGGVMLVDAGTRSAGEKVVAYLKEAGIDTIDKLVATHAHADHIGGMVEVMQNFEIGEVIDSGIPHTSQTYIEYLEYIDDNDIPFTVAEPGDKVDLGSGVDIAVVNSGQEGDSLNNASVSLHIEYQDTSLLITGDAEEEAERRIVNNFDVNADVLRVGHHGSNTSSNDFFLDAVQPEHAVFSYGEGNSYGHPHDEVIDRLQNRGVDIYSTAEQGNIVANFHAGNVSFYTSPWDVDVTPVEPEPEPTPDPEPQPDPKPSPGLININTAGYEELQEITGVGPAIAENIIEYRNTHGGFDSIEEIMQVSGIAEGRFSNMKDEITV